MLVLTVISPVLGANCYVVAPGAGRPCVIVDPGVAVAREVQDLVAEHSLRPVAMLATHAHLDHVWDAAELCETYSVPLWVHRADVHRLSDPWGSVSNVASAVQGALAAAGVAPESYRRPALVRTFGEEIAPAVPQQRGAGVGIELFDLGGVVLSALPAPGHTEGSTLYVCDGVPGAVLTGDVLFAGTVGRTDLPGGDHEAMGRTLRDVVGVLDPDALVLPGHGPATSMATERAHNQFLAGL